jgi:diguanylate cyclase
VLAWAIEESLAGLLPEALDALTGLPNHRSFRENLSRIRRHCARLDAPIAMFLADVDGFGELNELHSHKVGDQVLHWMGGVVRRRCRPGDFVARYDWDQFAVFLPGCTEQHAVETAERCRSEWVTRPAWLSLVPADLKVSVGVSSLGHGFIESEQTLIRMAAAALREAKRLGGDRTMAWSNIATTCSRRGCPRVTRG